MSALGGRALKRIFNCLCNTNTPYNSLTLAHNAPHSLSYCCNVLKYSESSCKFCTGSPRKLPVFRQNMDGRLSSLVLLVLCSCMLVGGKSCPPESVGSWVVGSTETRTQVFRQSILISLSRNTGKKSKCETKSEVESPGLRGAIHENMHSYYVYAYFC